MEYPKELYVQLDADEDIYCFRDLDDVEHDDEVAVYTLQKVGRLQRTIVIEEAKRGKTK